jgi:hypothetical protein
MNKPPDSRSEAARRRDEVEAQWELGFRIAAGLGRILSAIGGFVILLYQAFFEVHDRTVLLIIAGGMLGPVVAASIAQVAAAFRGGAPGE